MTTDLADMEIRRLAPDHPDAAYLISRVQEIYADRYGQPDSDRFDRQQFTVPDGGFYVGYENGRPVASGAWRRTEHEALGAGPGAEIKRMYVIQEAQRRGLARWMLAHLEVEIAAAGIGVVILGTGDRQPEAIALYERAGYVPIPGFGHYADNPGAHFYAKRVHAA